MNTVIKKHGECSKQDAPGASLKKQVRTPQPGGNGYARPVMLQAAYKFLEVPFTYTRSNTMPRPPTTSIHSSKLRRDKGDLT